MLVCFPFQGFWLGPSLIDGSFQASMALADAAVGIGDLAEAMATKWHHFCWEGDLLFGGQNGKRVTCCRNLGKIGEEVCTVEHGVCVLLWYAQVLTVAWEICMLQRH